MTEAASVRNELEKSRRDVLDLSLRNPLLNFPARRNAGASKSSTNPWVSRELAEPGIRQMARRPHPRTSTRQRPVDGPAHDRAAGSRSPDRASPSLQAGARPCRNLPAKA